MRSAVESMNKCIQGYLHLNIGGIVKYSEFDDEKGNAENYINEIKFKEGEKLDLEEEWNKFCDFFFNDWTGTYNNFYVYIDDCMNLSSEFNSKEFIYLFKETNSYWIELVGEPLDIDNKDEESIWNCIAYYWIREKSEEIKNFITKKIQDKFNNL